MSDDTMESFSTDYARDAPCLSIAGVTKFFGGMKALADVHLEIGRS